VNCSAGFGRVADATWGNPVSLNRAADAQLAHARLQSGALHGEEDRGTLGTGDAPLCLLQSAEDVLAFGFFEGGDGGVSGS